MYRWVQHYAPELDRRCRPHLKASTDSWRVDETSIKIKKQWMYWYRAVDSQGNTLEFFLSPTRDSEAAKHFFLKTLVTPHTTEPRVINVDKNAASPKAFAELKVEGRISASCELRQVKYLNNIVEQDHRFIYVSLDLAQIAATVFTAICRMKLNLVWIGREGEMMTLMAWLSSWFLAALLAQTSWPTKEAVRGGRQAAIVAVLCQPILQRFELFLHLRQLFAQLCIFLSELSQLRQVLTQRGIFCSELFEFFVLGHAATLADLGCCWQLPGPSEQLRFLHVS